MVISLTKDKILTVVSPQTGLFKIEAKAVILAMGCRERTRGALNIPGTRPSGILTAGAAQRFINIGGYMPGREVVILGSGDIGLIMARRMTLEGAKVKMVCEIMPHSGGLARNISQCLNDFEIPLKLSHTVVGINGKDRIESVVIAKVDKHLKPIKDTEEIIKCDTLLLSVGLIPENELTSEAEIILDNKTSGAMVNESMMTSADGIFACGNVLHVHDLVDFVTEEGYKTGKSAAEYIKNSAEFIRSPVKSIILNLKGESEKEIRYDIIHKMNTTVMTCVICPKSCEMTVESENQKLISVTGHKCKRGIKYARDEIKHPRRTLTSTVIITNGGEIKFMPVKTDKPVAKDKIFEAMKEINKIKIEAPVKMGDILYYDFMESGINLVAGRDVE